MPGWHGDGEGNALETGDKMEGALLWCEYEGVRCVDADDERAGGFEAADGLRVGVLYGVVLLCDDGQDEREWN